MTWINHVWFLAGNRFMMPFLEPLGYFRAWPKWLAVPMHRWLHIAVPNFLYWNTLDKVTDTTQEFNDRDVLLTVAGHYPMQSSMWNYLDFNARMLS